MDLRVVNERRIYRSIIYVLHALLLRKTKQEESDGSENTTKEGNKEKEPNLVL